MSRTALILMQVAAQVAETIVATAAVLQSGDDVTDEQLAEFRRQRRAADAAAFRSKTPAPEPEPAPRSPAGDAIALQDDAGYKTLAGKPFRFNLQYVLWNDAPDRGEGLNWTGIDERSIVGGMPVSLGSDGTVTFTPKPGFVGRDGVRYHAMDPAGRSGSAVVWIEVTAVQEAVSGRATEEPGAPGRDPEEPGTDPAPLAVPDPRQGGKYLAEFILPTMGQDIGPGLQAALTWSEMNRLSVIGMNAHLPIKTGVHVPTTQVHEGEFFGLFGDGAHLISGISDGKDVIHFEARHYARGLRVHDLMVRGSGQDGAGIHISGRLLRPGGAPPSGSMYNWGLHNVVVEGTGGDAFFSEGESFEAWLNDCVFRDAKNGCGARFTNGPKIGDDYVGVGSAIHVTNVILGGNGKGNRKHGVSVEGGMTHVSLVQVYALENGGNGYNFKTGCSDGSGMTNCGGENNLFGSPTPGGHIYAEVRMNLVNVLGSVSDKGNSIYLLDIYLTHKASLFSCGMSGRESRAGKTQLVRLDGVDTGLLILVGCEDETVQTVGAAKWRVAA